jgi:hypothetical protein
MSSKPSTGAFRRFVQQSKWRRRTGAVRAVKWLITKQTLPQRIYRCYAKSLQSGAFVLCKRQEVDRTQSPIVDPHFRKPERKLKVPRAFASEPKERDAHEAAVLSLEPRPITRTGKERRTLGQFKGGHSLPPPPVSVAVTRS